MKYLMQCLTLTFFVPVVVSHLATSGTFFKEITNTKESEDDDAMTSMFFHNCVQDGCRFVAKDSNGRKKIHSSIPNAENTDNNEVWKKMEIQMPVFIECKDALKKGMTKSGPVSLSWGNGSSFQANCDMETGGGGWTVVQRRYDSRVNFMRGWEDFARGFGDLYGNYWLGLRAMHHLMRSGTNTLRFDLHNNNSESGYAEFSNAKVNDEASKFLFDYQNYEGNIGNAMATSKGQFFSTFDMDNDNAAGIDCAMHYKGAWWHNKCFLANLNNVYPNFTATTTTELDGKYADWMSWYTWKNAFGTIVKSEMKIRPT